MYLVDLVDGRGYLKLALNVYTEEAVKWKTVDFEDIWLDEDPETERRRVRTQARWDARKEARALRAACSKPGSLAKGGRL